MLSIIFHVLLFAIISQQFSQKKIIEINKKNKNKPIQATLYFPPIKEPESETIKEIETPKPKQSQVKELPVASLPTNKPNKPNKPKIEKKELTKVSIKPAIKEILTNETSTKSITQRTLEKLRNRLHNQAVLKSEQDSLDQYIADKNSIDRSSTKLYAVPEAKAKKVEVDCNASALSTAVVVLSGLTGGSFRCNSQPNLKAFLKKRAEEKGR
jgi:hypothetical protein